VTSPTIKPELRPWQGVSVAIGKKEMQIKHDNYAMEKKAICNIKIECHC
jgi:hypothetical protein